MLIEWEIVFFRGNDVSGTFFCKGSSDITGFTLYYTDLPSCTLFMYWSVMYCLLSVTVAYCLALFAHDLCSVLNSVLSPVLLCFM